MAGIIFGGARGVVGGSETLKRGGAGPGRHGCRGNGAETHKGLASCDTNPLFCMAFPTGVEPVACPLGGDRSILLSYGNLVAGIIQEALCF